jgi:hypothetical protein
MKNTWTALILMGCIGICFFLLGRGTTLSSEEGPSEGLIEAVTIEEEDIEITLQPDAVQAGSEESVERTIFISIPDAFEDLDRAPVKFYHDKHALALEKEGCEKCHSRDEENKFLFTFPKERDESSRDALMNSYHDGCIGCHQEMTDGGEKTGPLTCGECHVIEESYHKKEYLPIMPEYYEVLRDTYHKDCLACHQDPAKAAEDAGGLDWKSFYVKEQPLLEETWPEVLFDYYIHDKHDKTLEEKCELCHYISPKREKELADEGKEPTCKDWLREIDEEQSLTERETAHPRCINCHLERKDANEEKTGPIYCKDCHTGIERTLEEMADVPRPECEQEEKILIQIEEDARAKGVAFNHKAHQEKTRSCQECHHETLRSCKECHTLTGSDEGDGITLAEAYHEVSSPWSCIGCHETEKQKENCAGCHHLMESGLVESACDTCHTGSLDSLDVAKKLPQPEELFPEDLKDELEINMLENEYKPSPVLHKQIVKKLTDISNENTLASYFHVEETTICAGCHHLGPIEKNQTIAQCSTCHTTRKEPERETPTLLGAYHQQCLGCHKHMGGTEEEMPQDCAGCHKEKDLNQTEAEKQ